MNWEKIKKIVIWILVSMNAVLFGINYKKSQQYVLSAEREKAIYTVLAKNDIGMYTELKGSFAPMTQISVEIPEFSRSEIGDMFFPGEEIEFSTDDDWTIISGKSGQATFMNNEFSFVSYDGTGEIDNFSSDKAIEASDKFISDHSSIFKNLKFKGIEGSQDGFLCKYEGEYKSHRIFCMDLYVFVKGTGVMWAEGTLYDIKGYYGISSEICAQDEALMTLIHSIEETDETKFITEVSLGYDILESRDISGQLRLGPSYHIYIQGKNTPIVINAYTNEIKN